MLSSSYRSRRFISGGRLSSRGSLCGARPGHPTDDLKSKLRKTTRSLYPVQEHHDRALASLMQHMDEENAQMNAELTQQTEILRKTKSKKAKYKTGYSQEKNKICNLHNALAVLTMTRDQYQDDLADMKTDRDRLRSLLSDWVDQVGRLQTQISDLEAERDRVLRDRDALRASINNFASSLTMPPSPSLVVVAPSLPGSSGVKDSAETPNVRSKRTI
uniref:Uncharacterized protein n=1 Tax=Hyaloperonospora arabidopsidis (strain Emoy2) TaxID=559515 RepID=M4C570_HYAAE